MGFVHLHCHTSRGSFLDAGTRMDELAEKIERIGQTAIAVTDHGFVGGTFRLQERCLELGIKPIHGMEAYLATQADASVKSGGAGDYYHLTLLAQNRKGWQNLVRINNYSYEVGLHHRPRIDFDFLKRHSEGVIVLSGCVAAELPQTIGHKGMDAARKVVRKYLNAFGDRFFLEIMYHGCDSEGIDHVAVEEDNKVLLAEGDLNAAMFDLADEFGIPVVATNDAHYLDEEHGWPHDVVLCIGTGTGLTAKDRPLVFSGQDHEAWEFYVKTEDEMRVAHPSEEWQRACDNTVFVADMVESGGMVEMADGVILPDFPIPDDDYDFKMYQKTGLLPSEWRGHL